MDFLKYFYCYSQKMMISPYYFGPPVLRDPVETVAHSYRLFFDMSSTVGLYIERFLAFYDVNLDRNAEEFSTESFQKFEYTHQN
jgi:hypothetical protein